MNITRNTRRADGVTVGEAMDREAAALRALGISVPDGAKTFFERQEEFTEDVRQTVLSALDEVAKRHFKKARAGWKDEDLSTLFKSLDAHAERLFWNLLIP